MAGTEVVDMKKDPVVHFEMPYKEAERTRKFYKNAFGWEMKLLGKEMGDYITAETTETDEQRMVKQPGNINGGFYPAKADSAPECPSVVIAVEDIKGAMERIRKEGGKVLGEPMMIPGIGQYVSFIDTEGNRVSILQPIAM
jgi:uncharacterized protein